MYTFRKIAIAVIGISGPVVLLIMLAEIFLRFMPVQSLLQTQPVNEGSPVFHARPGIEFSFSRGWAFKIANHGRINNEGFVNDQDYVRAGPRPLIAVIGDSYIEALMVPYAETLQGRLAHAIGAKGRVYSFAFSGAALSQYLVWAKYASTNFGIDALIVNVVGNDFDESLSEYKQGPGFHHYRLEDSSRPKLQLVPYEPNPLRVIAHESALMRYLILNLELLHTARTLWQGIAETVAPTPSPSEQGAPEDRETTEQQGAARVYVGNTDAAADTRRVTLSKIAVDAFLEDIPEYAGLERLRILFTLDAARSYVYHPTSSPALNEAYFGIVRTYFIEHARSLGHEVIDLQTVFSDRYAEENRRFEFDIDGHWSGYGHGVAARAIMKSRWYERLVAGHSA